MSPSPSWYEPADVIDVDSDPEPDPAESLVIVAGVVWWTLAEDDDLI